MSIEQRKKLSDSHTGYKFSDEAKMKMSVIKKGRHISPNTEFKKYSIPWNKGIALSENAKENLRIIMTGKKQSSETIAKKVAKSLGSHRSAETKLKMSLASKGKPKSEEHKRKYKEVRKNWITPKYNTSIEIKIRDFLDSIKMEYYQHKHLDIEHNYACDFFIPSLNLVIETDGNYWHRYPTGTDIDHIRTKELVEKGFKVLRLWESEIKVMTIEQFKEKLT